MYKMRKLISSMLVLLLVFALTGGIKTSYAYDPLLSSLDVGALVSKVEELDEKVKNLEEDLENAMLIIESLEDYSYENDLQNDSIKYLELKIDTYIHDSEKMQEHFKAMVTDITLALWSLSNDVNKNSEWIFALDPFIWFEDGMGAPSILVYQLKKLVE